MTDSIAREPSRSHAIVLGGSMAGLLAVRVLSDYFERVTLVERDALPESRDPRKGVPQGRHLHALLVRGEQILSRLFPGLTDDLVAAGAERIDLPGDVRWFQCGGYKPSFESGIAVLSMSRPLLEGLVRARVRALPNVRFLDGWEAEHLVPSADGRRVTGAVVRPRAEAASSADSISSDLVVDARGRGSQAPRWLEALGHAAPPETTVKIGLGYVTRLYRARPDALRGAKAAFTMPVPPRHRRGGALMPIEGGRWIVTVCGWLGDHAPTDDAGFLEYVDTLAAPDIVEAVRGAEPISDFTTHKFPSNLRRHYERLPRFPDGYLVLGDAVASFNPVYGQGMTVSACQADALDACLRERQARAESLAGLPLQFFKRATPAVDAAWMLATGEDFRFPEVDGPRPPGITAVNWYVELMQRASNADPAVTRAFYRVMTMTEPPTALFSPRIAWRIARHGLWPGVGQAARQEVTDAPARSGTR